MDIEGLISGLVNASKQPISRLQTRTAAAKAAVTDLSDVGGLLSKLKTAATALDSQEKVGSYKASSSNENALAITANGNAQPGAYDVKVLQLAAAERRYSNGATSSNAALGHTGTLTLQIGTGDTVSPESPVLVGGETATLNIEATDSLDSIIQKINDSGIRVKASSFYDGKQYRLQIRGLDTGEDNAVIIKQNNFDLGLEDEANIATKAQNAKITVDGFEVQSATNTIGQAIPGVSLSLKQVTSEAFNISVQDDTDALGSKVKDFVDAYNAVVNKVHTTAGFGKTKASNPLLAGDSSLRGITSRLNSQLSRTFGTGQFNTMASVGIQLNNDGTLRLDQTKLTNAISKDSRAVTDIIAGSANADGMMDMMRELASTLTAPNSGTLDVRKEGLQSQAKRYDTQIGVEQKRLETLETRLRKTFSEMDSTVAGYKSQLNYLLANS
jgi:flagellar hook-associated protein 2